MGNQSSLIKKEEKNTSNDVFLSNDAFLSNEVENEDTNIYQQIKVIVIGAGCRGNIYATYAIDFPDQMSVVGVAEPNKVRRMMFQKKYNLSNENVFSDWKEVVLKEKFADAVIIATLDDLHYEPCLAFSNLGYHILCEKPMAPTEEECEKMVEAAKQNNIILAIGHVMRYTNHYMTVKKLIDDGSIGELIGIQHLEPVGWWHFAHSFVRGNWRKTVCDIGSLMTKSCHDLDLIKFFFGSAKCTKIQSFGSLVHFTSTKKPLEASDRCLDCSIEKVCPYSAVRQYLGPVKQGFPDMFCHVVCDIPDIENMTEALRTGPYGRCVYNSDNNVCDYQVVNMEFEGSKYASFTMSAFTKDVCSRKITIMGSKGRIICDGNNFELFQFDTMETSIFKSRRPKEETNMSGHGFADYYLMKSFVTSVASNNKDLVKSGPEDSLRGHRLVFAAERSRLLGGEMLKVDI
ncbi:uncharacterized protein LOC100198727 isoform X4 [Hydra vulgaris]|uniref:Uncharacterized protein LOC100198727 isoform X4 n=2 Tax=Hydra vulgaris TaxID=6087 RepID=A0ABM4DEN6_HYDVU